MPVDGLRARISLHQVHPLDRHEKLRFLGIEEQHKLAAARAEIERLQATKTPDAMIDVDDKIADFQIAKVRKEGGGLQLLLFRARFLCSAVSSDAAPLELGVPRFVKEIALDVNHQARSR